MIEELSKDGLPGRQAGVPCQGVEIADEGFALEAVFGITIRTNGKAKIAILIKSIGTPKFGVTTAVVAAQYLGAIGFIGFIER